MRSTCDVRVDRRSSHCRPLCADVLESGRCILRLSLNLMDRGWVHWVHGMVDAHGLCLSGAMRRHMDCGPQRRRSTLRSVCTRASRGIAQYTLSNLLLRRDSKANAAILTRGCDLIVVLGIGRRVRRLVLEYLLALLLSRRTNATMCRSVESSLLLCLLLL